jgi:hypothetical protein
LKERTRQNIKQMQNLKGEGKGLSGRGNGNYRLSKQDDEKVRSATACRLY